MKVCKVSDLPCEESIPFGQKYIISSHDVSYLTHSIHKFPSKFIPHIPRWAMRKYLKGKRYKSILDPMCGSGTTLVEGILAGHHVYGIDIDPLARLISKVKITPIDEPQLKAISKEVIEKVESTSKGAFVPSLPTLRHWFKEDAIRDLSVIRDVIEEYRNMEDVYDFLIVVFSSIIRKVSNADDQSQKTYVSHTNPKTPPPVKPEFIKNLTNYVERICEFSKKKPSGTKSHIFENADARAVDEAFNAKNLGKIDLAITSPPYIKAIDYMYTQMAEYFWIGDLWGLSDQKSQNVYKTKYIGTKMIYADEYSDLCLTGLTQLDEKIKRIYAKNKKYAYITYKFFEDMQSNFESMYSVLKEGAHYVVVVGDCNVCGEPIEVRQYLIHIARKLGYDLENLFYYKIRNRYMRFPRKGRGGLITHDWIIDLQKIKA